MRSRKVGSLVYGATLSTGQNAIICGIMDASKSKAQIDTITTHAGHLTRLGLISLPNSVRGLSWFRHLPGSVLTPTGTTQGSVYCRLLQASARA